MAVSEFVHSYLSDVVWRLRYTALMLLVVGGAACGGGSAENAAGGGPGGGRGAMPPMPVEMVTLEPKPVEQVGDFVGTVKSRRSTTIQPQAEGFLTRIRVKSGDRVKPGTGMFDIDATMEQAGVASLESVRAAREADAEYARQQAARAKNLLGVGAMSQQEYEQAVTLQKTAEAQLKAVEDQIRQMQAELAFFRVTAPTAGIVGDIPVRVGERVTKATVLTTVDDNTGLEVYISVPVQQAPNLKVGLPVRIVTDAGVTIATERISFVAPSVEEDTQTVLAKATVTRAGQFRNDQFVRAQIVFAATPGLTMPVVSVVRIGGQYFAFVAEPGEGGGLVAKQRQVRLGPVIGNEYIVLNGLKAGDKLITGGIQKIGDGAPVQPAPPGAPPGDGRGGPGAGRGGD
ncbi:MAG TPA: efflux RND transporter periplasmic adaptor subunit [Vicinamibacterales bacterium]|nr:efflux RND transporter periplasmic adaptor subunit [Vicinamibacterales bacterium]